MKKARLFFYASIIMLLIVLGIWGYAVLTNPLRFPVIDVRVTGEYPHVPQQVLQTIILPYAQQGLFGFSAWQLQRDLEQIPWVDSVNIRRIWPDTMAVVVTEKIPVAVWNQAGLLTANGILYTPEKKSFPVDLPQLNGPEDKAAVMLTGFIKMNALFTKLAFSIQTFDMSARNSWTITLSNGMQVLVGQDDEWQRVQQFTLLYPQLIGSNAKKVGSVDLRYSNGIAIRWKN